MPTTAIPNLSQLQEFRKSGRFDPSLLPQKIDVMKSAKIVGVKIDGELVGFGTAERASPDEIAKLQVSKSAELPADENAIFDDSPLLPSWSPEVQPIGALEVSKSADTETPDALEGIFPPCLRNS